jgi:5-methylcytosine-specific restriction endonuclease McrA
MKLITRQNAKNQGKPFYFTGKPCPLGHISTRRVINWTCNECYALYNKTPKRKLYFKNWRERNPNFRENWREQNRELEQTIKNEYNRNNRPRMNGLAASRRANKLKATPFWADKQILKEVYDECPVGMVVDHIVPLQGKIVCGLHVPWNLQYLTQSENSKKSNKLIYW